MTFEPPKPAGMVRVADADPRRLGVHAAIDVPKTSGASVTSPRVDAAEVVGELPAYVERDADSGPGGMRALLARAVERGGLVVLVGGSSVGKTRSAYEALRTVMPEWRLLHPADVGQIDQAAATSPSRLVVWLDELQRYLGDGGGDGLRVGTVRALLDAGSVLVGTLWPDRYAAYTAPPAPGELDRYAEARQILGLADIVLVAADFSPAEQERAHAAAQADARIALALESADYGLTQTIAAAPQLVALWRGAAPYAAAVLAAAVDATRLGVHSPLSPELLRVAAPGYCDARQRAIAPANWFEAAMAYATASVQGGAALLAPVASHGGMGQVDGYLVADYLQQVVGRQRRTARVPNTTWQALLDHLTDPADLAQIERAAVYHGFLHQDADPSHHRADTSDDDVDRAALLAVPRYADKREHVDGGVKDDCVAEQAMAADPPPELISPDRAARRDRVAGLLQEARQGRREAFNLIAAELTPLLCQVMRCQGLDKEAAEDAIQTIWLTLLRHLDAITAPRGPGRVAGRDRDARSMAGTGHPT
ncbi:hypothetical protein [Nonomuraea sp. NEAU-A123]|uniref:hypothetical protein n=1 Tax=Nonomuraea sp. NEAU-A123 TaxID=2839649 RepID=UPI002032998E|nr:hypothetical protein [Nonomuraea sp. NEAU-A123]